TKGAWRAARVPSGDEARRQRLGTVRKLRHRGRFPVERTTRGADHVEPRDDPVAADRRAVGRRQVAETELVEPKEAVLDELRLERRARRLAIRRTGTVHDPVKEVARRRARASPFAHYLYRALVLDGIDDSAGAHRQPTAVAQLLD